MGYFVNSKITQIDRWCCFTVRARRIGIKSSAAEIFLVTFSEPTKMFGFDSMGIEDPTVGQKMPDSELYFSDSDDYDTDDSVSYS